MKKKLVYAAVALAMAGCADDALVSTEKNSESEIGKLVKAGLVSSAREDAQADNATRALSPAGHFVWMPRELDGDGKIANNSNQKVGFCWTGFDSNGFGAVTTVGTNVYTNYEFEHVGWLDRNANSVEFDECDGTLLNGAYIVGEGTPVASWTNVPNNLQAPRYASGGNSYYDTDAPLALGKYGNGSLALGKGVFKTENASVFQGQYLVYYPYTDMFTKGPIIANEPDHFDVTMNPNIIDRFVTYSDYGFCLGLMDQYEGGNRSTGFNSTNFASFATIRLMNDNPGSSNVPNPVKVESVILYSASANILVQKGIDAAQAISWLNGGLATIDSENNPIYTQTDQDLHVATVYANLTDGNNMYFEVPGAAHYQNGVPVSNNVIIPVLPQTVSDLQVLVIFEDGTSYSKTFSNQKFESGKASIMDVNLWNVTGEKTYLAYDEKSLVTAMTRAYNLGQAAVNDRKASTVKILNNIELSKDNDQLYNGDYNLVGFQNNVTITADESNKTACLTTAAGAKRSIKCLAASQYSKLTINVPCIIEGYGCCSNKPGMLSIGGKNGEIANVEFTKPVTNYGTLAVGNNTTASNIKFADLVNGWDDMYVTQQISKNGKFYSKGSLKRGKYTDAATIWLLGSDDQKTTSISIDNLTNNGGSIKAKAATLNGFKKSENFSLTQNQYALAERRVKITVNKDLTNKGEYVYANGTQKTMAVTPNDVAGGIIEIDKCAELEVQGQFKNMNEIAVLTIEGEGNSATTDGKVDLKNGGENKGTIDNKGVINMIQTLDNNGLFIDRLNSQVGGVKVNNGTVNPTNPIVKYLNGIHTNDNMYRTDLNTDGIYAAQVSTDSRMAFVLRDAVVYPSANVVEILDNEDAMYFNLCKYQHDLAEKDVRINYNGNQAIRFCAYNQNGQDQEKSFGDCVDIIKGYVLTRDGILSTKKNVEVYSGAKFQSANPNPGHQSETTIGRDLIINENAEFLAESRYEVGGDVQMSGKFTSNSSDNIVHGDFTQHKGTSTFAIHTTTTINGKFDCLGGTFTREQLGNDQNSRATVNVGTLGTLTGTSTTAWPTQM